MLEAHAIKVQDFKALSAGELAAFATHMRAHTDHLLWLHKNNVMALAVGRREPTRVRLHFWRVG